MRFSPRAYQLQAIDHLAAHPRCALWAGMGMGKTVSTLTALDTLALAEEDIFPALPQRRNRQREDLQPPVQVLAEKAALHLR